MSHIPLLHWRQFTDWNIWNVGAMRSLEKDIHRISPTSFVTTLEKQLKSKVHVFEQDVPTAPNSSPNSFYETNTVTNHCSFFQIK